MSLGHAFEEQAKRIMAMELAHAEELARTHWAWGIACAALLMLGFLLGKLT